MNRTTKLQMVYDFIIDAKIGCNNDEQYDKLNDASDALLDAIAIEKKLQDNQQLLAKAFKIT